MTDNTDDRPDQWETPPDRCERIDEGNDQWICHRCKALWFSKVNPSFRPMACPEYREELAEGEKP